MSREELIALVTAQATLIEELQARVADLGRQAGRNSQNSSTPPSADGLAKPPPRSMRKRSGRRPGKQDGAAGSHLAQVAVPDERERHFPARCGGCDRRLRRGDRTGEPVRRQVFDVPEMTVRVIEHELHVARCRACGTVTRADAPGWASAPAVYGPNVTALAAYLSAQHHIPVARVAEILLDTCGIEVSTGWVATACERAGAAVADANAAIADGIAAARVAHFDEGVTRVAGRNHWMHTAATATLTAYHIDEHGRGVEAIKAFGILPHFTGVAVHDAYAGYGAFTACTHALCNAHAVRELAGIAEFDAACGDDWAEQMIDLLGDAYRWAGAWHREGHTQLPEFKADDLRRRWDQLTARALQVHPPRPGKQTPARNLALRLRDRREEFLRFTTDFAVAFSNNIAEQAIRMVKVKTKVSGGFRTLHGAQTFLAIRGYISTVRKNGMRAAHSLREALLGSPWMPPASAAT